MSTELTPEQVIEAVYAYAAEQMRNGVSSPEIERSLIEKGLDAEVAQRVVENLEEARAKVVQEAAHKNMLHGGLWCAGGILVTALTYGAAAGSGGGKYVVAWGAIVFGGIQFFRGFIQSSGDN